jgi:hypothetical protein
MSDATYKSQRRLQATMKRFADLERPGLLSDAAVGNLRPH